MKFLTTFRLAVCVPVMVVVMIGPTVAKDEALPLNEQHYNQRVGLSDNDAPLFRHFYDATETLPKWNDIGVDAIVVSVETPPLSDGLSASFVIDTPHRIDPSFRHA
jgi:hypothetical protein